MYTTLKIRTVNLLRLGERYVKTDLLYLVKGGFWLSLGQLGYVPLAFGLSVAFANLVPPEVYGTYRFVLSLASIIGVFALTGIDAALPQAVARGYEGMLRKGFMTYLTWGWVMLSAAGVVAAYYVMHGNAVLGIGVLIAGATLPLFSGASLYGEFLAGRREFRIAAFAGALQTAFTTAVMVTTMLVAPDPLTLIAAYFLSNACSSLALYAWVWRRYHPNGREDPESARFGYHVSVTNVIGVIADQLDKVLVFHLVGAAELAGYAFATAMPEYLRSLSKMFNSLAVPKFAVRDAESMRESILRKTVLLVLALTALTVCYAIAAPYLFRLFYPHYLGSIPYSQVYALVILSGAATLPAAAINAQRDVHTQYVLSLSDNLLRIALLFGLAYLCGVWGIIAARILGRLFTLVFSSYLVAR